MYTGNSSCGSVNITRSAVYPCVYRELVRHSKSAVPVRRFIPVYTGNSVYSPQYMRALSVYPCVYRELTLGDGDKKPKGGLSLCIQGTHTYFRCFNMVIRFIPVYTGNSNTLICFMISLTVYPCVYRELPPGESIRKTIAGLSLCIQGTRAMISCLTPATRFIPVYTGNSDGDPSRDDGITVYPCVYREL